MMSFHSTNYRWSYFMVLKNTQDKDPIAHHHRQILAICLNSLHYFARKFYTPPVLCYVMYF